MYLHGDFSSARVVLSNVDRDALSCLRGVYSYWGTILFSIETQQTIGYGTRSINEECSVAIVFLIIQSCFGLLIQSLWVGLVYTRLSRPRKRRQTLIWSRHALISRRDGWRVLQIRLGDMRQRSTLVEAHLRMYFVSERTTTEKEVLPINLFDMKVGFAEGKDRIVLNWPLIIEHRIDEESPFFRMDFSQFSRSHFEIFVILEGIIESTGMVTQAKTSFLPSEIIWNRRFQSMIEFDSAGHLLVDYNRFHQTIDDPFASLLAPAQLYEQQQPTNTNTTTNETH